MADTYRVVRFFKSGKRKIIMRGVSRDIAKLHCSSQNTKGKTWFDGFEKEGGGEKA